MKYRTFRKIQVEIVFIFKFTRNGAGAPKLVSTREFTDSLTMVGVAARQARGEKTQGCVIYIFDEYMRSVLRNHLQCMVFAYAHTVNSSFDRFSRVSP